MPGRPRSGAVVGDALRSAAAQPVVTGTTAVVTALVCLVVLLTAGRAAAAERAVVASIDAVGTRLITVSDPQGQAAIDPETVDQVAALEGVRWAFGLGPASDGRSVALPGRAGVAAMRPVVGDLPSEAAAVRGRAPRAVGEAVAGTDAAAALRLVDGAGAVSDGSTVVGVVGVVDTGEDLGFLDALVLYRAASVPTLSQVYVLADDASTVPELQRRIAATVRAGEPSRVQVEASAGVLRLRDAVAGALGASSRQLMLGVLGGGLVLVSVTVLSAVQGRRRDLGRRRAVGASRSAIVVLVLLQTAVAGVMGALVGSVGGVAAVALATGVAPPGSFSAGVAVATVLIGLVGAAPPALLAAYRDPVRILRVP
ncbi:hypothetical protein ATM99_14530 [Cellulomonas sp. B6]|nr:hypothetical protein ATM99_14530 [Cellulomonas sp. B6]